MISNPADRKKIRDALDEISNSMTRIAAERDLIKEIIADVSEQHELPKKVVSKMARTYYKQTFNQEQQDFDQFATLFEEVTKLGSGS